MQLPWRSLPPLWIALAFAVLVLQARVVIGGQTLDDVRYHTHVAPPRLAAAEAIAARELPAWWEGAGFGVPLLGEPTHGAVYPVTWLASSPRALDWIVILHLWWFALGVALWARRGGASEPAALVAGLLVATSGVAASCAAGGSLFALAHLPWIAVAARRPAWIGVLLGMIGLAGSVGVLVVGIGIAIGLGLGLEETGDRPAPWQIVVAIVAGVAISAFQWWPAVLALRANAGATIHGLPLASCVALFVPGALYAGAALVGLAAAARWSVGAVVVASLAAVLAIAWGRGGWPAWLGAPEALVGALVAVAAVEAARGVDLVLAGDRRARIVVAAAAILGAVALAAAGAARAAHAFGTGGERPIIDGALGLLCIGAACVVARPSGEERARAWRAPVVIALLVAPGIGATPTVWPATSRSIVDEMPAFARSAAQLPEPRRIARRLLGGTPDNLDDAAATLAGEIGARWGIASAYTDDPARPALHDAVWLGAAHMGGELLRRFGIAGSILPATMAGSTVVTELARRGDAILARVPADPPASTIANWIWLSDPHAAIEALFPPAAHPPRVRRLVLSGEGVPNEEAQEEPTPCTVARWSPGAIDVACTADLDTYAVVTSSPADGWTVTVDGAPARWVTADLLRRAVALPAGTHHIAWRFSAPGLAIGALAAACGLAGLVLLALARRGARQRRSRSS